MSMEGQDLSMKGDAEPNLKVLKWVLGGVCKESFMPAGLCWSWGGSALLTCWYWSYSPEIPPNTPVNLAFYYPLRVQYVTCLWAAQQQLLFCFADSFHPGAEADAHWRQAEGMSWESAENHSEQNELISWEKMGTEGVGRFEVVCVPNRLCVTCFNDFKRYLFFNWNVQLLYL